MPTQRPRIQIYLSEEIHAALLAYSAANNLDSMSIALARVLAEFFGTTGPNSQTLQTRLKALEQKVEGLTGRLDELTEVFVDQLPTELTNMEMLQRLRMDRSTLAYRREKDDFPQWSKKYDPDGLAWTWNPKTKVYTRYD